MKNKSIAHYLKVFIITIIIGTFIFWIGKQMYSWVTLGGEYDTFTQCLTEKGVKFYGAFWCPHCQEQKKIFGRSAKKLPYIECSTADGQGQTQICKDMDIKGYPTWILANEERLTPGTNGFSIEKSLEILSEKTQCPLIKNTN